MSRVWIHINKALATSVIALIAMLVTPLGALAMVGPVDQTATTIIPNQYNWINVGEIDFSSKSPQRFINRNIDLNNNAWTWEADPDKCPDSINNLAGDGSATLNIKTYVNTSTSQSCKTTQTQKIQLYDNAQASKISFKQVTANQFELIGSPHKWLYNFDSGKTGTQYVRNNDNNCQDVLAKDSNGNWTLTSAVEQRNGITHIGLFDGTTIDGYLQQDYWGYPFDNGLTYASKTDDSQPKKCWISKQVSVSVDAISGAPAPTYGTTGPGVTAPADQDPCASASGSYAWILCPAVAKATEFLGAAYGTYIEPLLNINPLTQQDEKGNVNGIYAVWKAFVSLANILFVLAFIGIIFGTVLNLDAYTVKKALPRLVIAAVVVQLSFFLCGILIDISNIFGNGMLDFIRNAIPAAASTGAHPGSSVISYSILALGTAAFAAALVLGPAAALMVIGFVVSVFIFIVTLLIRQLIIIVLIVLSPIAFVAWIMPNTEGLFKKWKDNFLKLLFIYPIMSILIGSAYIIQAASTGGSAVAQIIGGVAPMIAFFLMPTVFKMSGKAMGLAGGAVGKIGGRINKGVSARTEKAYDNSALLKQREQKKLIKNLGTAQGTGLRARVAQSRAGFGFVKTAGSQSASYGKLASLESAEEAGASRQLQSMNAAQLKNIATSDVGSTTEGVKISDASKKAAVAKLAKTGSTKELAAVKAQLESTVEGKEIYRTAVEQHFKEVKTKAPHLVPGGSAASYDTVSAADISQFNKDGMDAFKARVNTDASGTTRTLSVADDAHFTDAAVLTARKNARTQQTNMTATQKSGMKGDEAAVYNSL